MCTKRILDSHLGFVTHKTQVEPFTVFTKKEEKYLEVHEQMYRDACASSHGLSLNGACRSKTMAVLVPK